MNVLETVKNAICRSVPGIDDSKIVEDARLKEDLEIDSLTKVEIALALEDELNISIQDGNLGSITTVGQVVELVESRLKVRNA